jgi:hypothetical protein
VLGKVEPNITISEKSKESDENSNSLRNSIDESKYLAKKQKERMARLALKFGIGGEKVTALIAENKITPISKVIIKYWLMRMRFIRKLRIYVEATINANIFYECLFCRYTYGLQSELI